MPPRCHFNVLFSAATLVMMFDGLARAQVLPLHRCGASHTSGGSRRWSVSGLYGTATAISRSRHHRGLPTQRQSETMRLGAIHG